MIYLLLYILYLPPILIEIYSMKSMTPSSNSILLLYVVTVFNTFLLFLFISGFRYKTGYDWIPYENYYLTFPNKLIKDNIEIGFIALYGIGNILQLDFCVIQFIISLFVSLVLYKFYLNNSPFPIFSLFLYTCFFYHIINMGFERQAIAIGFCLLAYMSFIENKKKTTLIYIFVGVLFHYSAILFCLIFVLNDTKYNPKISIILLFISYFIFSNWGILNFIFLIINDIPFIPSKVSSMINLYLSLTNMTSNAGFFGLGWLSKRVIIWFALIYLKPQNKNEIVILKLTLIGAIFESFGFTIIILARLSYVFLCFEYIVIALLLKKLLVRNKHLKNLIFSLFIAFYLLQGPINFVFLRNDAEANRYKPYYSILFKPIHSDRIEKQIWNYYNKK